MRIKTFQGRSIEEILPQIREELGPQAVVVGQRQKVQGGVAGFFGTKVIEVTAADSMPGDDELVALEDRFMGGDSSDASASSDDGPSSLTERFAGAMRMGRRGGIDVTDEWDPAKDAELAQEYGRVLEHAAAGGFSELDVPVIPANAARLATTPLDVTDVGGVDPMSQAMDLARRTHEHVRNATEGVDQTYAAASGTYAPPRALPRTPEQQLASTRSFTATVDPSAALGFEPQAVATSELAAATVDHALRTDLAMPRSTDAQLAEALGNAVQILDLDDIATLRSAVNATRRTHEATVEVDSARSVLVELDAKLAPIRDRMLQSGVDSDIVTSIVDTAVRHRLPFGGEQDASLVVRGLVEETIEVRSGFPLLERVYRMAFVGAAHAGRTSMVTKVASRYALTGMRVGILSIVAIEPGAPIIAERAFEDLTGVDVRYAATTGQALDAIDAFTEYDLVLVDTPGSAYLDPAVFDQVRSSLLAIGIDDVHVVLPLATSSREARSIVDAFRMLGANRLAVTRLDECRHVGEILNLCFRLGLPITFLSEGPHVPNDLRAADARHITDRILTQGHHRS